MSSDPQHVAINLSSKFENEYTDINRLLDTVIGKNSRTAAIVSNQDPNISATSDFDHRPHAKGLGNVFDKNVLQDLVQQGALRENESNETARFSQADTQVTPVKSRQAPSSGKSNDPKKLLTLS